MPPTATSRVPERPRVPDWQRPYVRRPGEVQFGLLPGAPLVTGVSTTEAALLAGLDGNRTREQTYRTAADAGLPRRRWRELLELMLTIGVLQDAAVGPAPEASVVGGRLRPRSDLRGPSPTILVGGGGRLADDLAAALREARLGRVVADPTDVDLAVADPMRHRVDVAVIVGGPVVDPRRGDVWLGRSVPHLPIALAGPRATIGPLVDPRRPGPCLWCLDRHRTDHDAAWPTVMTQALGRSLDSPEPGVVVTPGNGASPDTPPGLAQLVSGAATLVLGRFVRGEAPPAGVSVEVSLPWPRMDHRRWLVHPLCPGHLAAADDRPAESLAEGA